jgi:2-dehydropantoate 2-reductase
MTDRVRALVVGAGAVGGYFGACLARAGHDVTFVARGANLDALRASGLLITGAMGDFEIRQVQASTAPDDADIVLACVKSYDLDAALEPLRDGNGIVLTLQNGVEAPYRARDALGDRVLAGTTGIVSDLPEPGHVVVVSPYAWIRFGEPDGSGISDQVRRVTLWEKMALMCGMAGLTSLHQRPLGEILADSDLRATFESIVAECETVARAKGVPLREAFAADRMAYADRIAPESMSSMSRDLARGRRIELETFNGTIVRMGAELGIPVPYNAEVYAQLRGAAKA